jgi:tetratricopeptide (TPR) repeat protein/tRNA A-37 threonylcarbamoyl transferase component Bud32
MKPDALPVGTQVGRYLVGRLVGEGRSAAVYVARDTELDRELAIKLMRPDAPDARARLLRQAQAMAKLQHPNVVAVYEAGVHGDDVFVAMELVVGTTLPVWRQAAPRTWREILDVFLAAGRGLAAAHAQGLVHRDFRPEHVLIDEHGAVKVGDFGLTRTPSAAEADTVARPDPRGPSSVDDLPTTSFERTGALTGPAAYLAPEQAMGLGVDARTDEYSFGVALYRAIYGEPPYAKDFPARGPNLQPAPMGTLVPAWVRAPLLRGISLRPEDRYATLDELLAELAADPARRGRVAKYLGVLAVLAVVVATSLMLVRRYAALDPCHDPARRLAGVWDESVKERVRAAFIATGLRDAPSIVDYAAREMDGVSAAWVAAYADACREAHEAHTASEAELRLRLECLDEQRIDLRAAAELMSHPDPKDLPAVLGAASALEPPIECADPQARIDPPPPENRARIEAVHARFSRAKALQAVGRHAQALAIFTSIPDEANAVGARALEVEGLLELATVYGESGATGDAEKASEAATRAAHVAKAAHLDVLTVKALAAEVYFSTQLGEPAAELDAKLGRTRQAFRRLPPGTTAEVDLEIASGAVNNVEGRDQDALESARRLLALTKKLYGANSRITADNEFNLGIMFDFIGEYDDEVDQYRKAVASYDARLGPTNAYALSVELTLAETYFDLSRFDECELTLKHVWARTSPTTGEYETASILASQSALLAVRGQRADSLRAAARALEIFTRLNELKSITTMEYNEFLLAAYVLDREPRLAIALYEQDVAPQELTPASTRWVAFLRLAGWAYLDAGQPNQAIPLFERALSLSQRRRFYPGWVARMHYQLSRALVLTNGDRQRATALAQQAHDELAEVPAMKDLLAEVDAFRAKTLPTR